MTKTIRWRFVDHNGRYFRHIGIMDDGTLYNPNGYPDADVREAVEAANEQRRQRRIKGAKKAAVTRARRREKLVYSIAQRLLKNEPVGPSTNCVVCGKFLGDQVSYSRGIGSDCYEVVRLRMLEKTVDQFGASTVARAVA